MYIHNIYIYNIIYIYMGVSKNNGTPKSSILIGFFIINHPFWGVFPLFLETPIYTPENKHGSPENTPERKRRNIDTKHQFWGSAATFVHLGCIHQPVGPSR